MDKTLIRRCNTMRETFPEMSHQTVMSLNTFAAALPLSDRKGELDHTKPVKEAIASKTSELRARECIFQLAESKRLGLRSHI